MQVNIQANEKDFTLQMWFVLLQKASQGGDANAFHAVLKAIQKMTGFSGVFQGAMGVTIYSKTPPVPGESRRDPMLLSITNLLDLAYALSVLARRAGSPRTTALVSSQGSSSSHQPLTLRERTAEYLFASAYFFIREEMLISGDASKIIM